MSIKSEQKSSGKEQQNFGVNEAKFKQMLEELKQGNESLFEQIFLAHVKDCIAFLMRKYQSSHEEAYDATLDALLEFRKRLLDGKVGYGNMRYLFTKMAGQILLKAKKKWQTNPLEMLSEIPENEIEEEIGLEELDKAWNLLGESCSTLLKAFYYSKQQLKEIAVQTGKSEVALRKQKQRCLEKLRTHFLKFYHNH